MAFVLGIIPARGGSKGIPGKNTSPLAGRPLIAHSIKSAIDSAVLSDVVVSTDSEEIAKCATAHGLPTNKLRPAHLATDHAKTIDTLIYEIERYEAEHALVVDVLVLLQPTTPLRTGQDIDAAFHIFVDSGSDSLISVYEASSVHPSIMYTSTEGKLAPLLQSQTQGVRRQEFATVYVRNGAIYMMTRELLLKQRKLIGEQPAAYVMSRERSINIDEPYDLELADWAISRNGSN